MASWMNKKLTQKQKKMLAQAAHNVRGEAYAPYSRYQVGAAVLAEDGQIYSGVNIENAAYPSSICAERVAIFKAVSNGNRRLLGLAVSTANGGAPCGGCRQVMREFGGTDLPVLILDGEGKIALETSLAELLPRSFGPEGLAS